MPPTPAPIVVQAPPIDWWTRTSVIATVAAAVLALISIEYARRSANKGRRQLIADRRATYDLGVLTTLAEVWIEGRNPTNPDPRQRLRALLHALPGDDLPMLRAMLGVRSTPAGRQRLLTLTHARLDDPTTAWPNADWPSTGARQHLTKLTPEQVGDGSVLILWEHLPLRQEIAEEIVSAIDSRLHTSDETVRGRRSGRE